MEAKETIEAQWGKFARWVKAERARRGWSQEEAALKIGKTKMTWYRVEKGEPTKRETVLLIADVFGAPRSFVLGLAGFASETGEQLSTPQRLAQILVEAMDEATLADWLAIGHLLYDRRSSRNPHPDSPLHAPVSQQQNSRPEDDNEEDIIEVIRPSDAEGIKLAGGLTPAQITALTQKKTNPA